MSTVLITGANGFAGKHLVKHYVHLGHEVRALIRSRESDLDWPEGVSSFTVDELEQALSGVDIVFHLAAEFSPKNDADTVASLFESNVALSMRILTAMMKICPEAHFVGASTFTQLDKDGERNPMNFYSATKQAAQDLARQLPLRTSFIRVCDTYGPGDVRSKVPNLLRSAAEQGKPFTFRSPAETLCCMIHIEDLCQFYQWVAEREQKHGENFYEVGIFDSRFIVSLGVLAESILQEFPEYNKEVLFPIVAEQEPIRMAPGDIFFPLENRYTTAEDIGKEIVRQFTW